MPSSRRDFLRQSSALLLAPSLSGLVACSRGVNVSGARTPSPIRRAALGSGGYGPLVAAGPELALPAGFTYTVVIR